MSPTIAAVDESAAGAPSMSGTATLGGFIDETSLEAQTAKAAARNKAETEPYRRYIANVIKTSGVRDSQLTRRMASNICGAVARLPFLPDDKEKVEGEKTEFDLQVEKTAEQAEAALGAEAVATVSARKIARVALDLRKKDPEGEKGIAWVNDPFEVERGPGRRVPRTMAGEPDEDGRSR